MADQNEVLKHKTNDLPVQKEISSILPHIFSSFCNQIHKQFSNLNQKLGNLKSVHAHFIMHTTQHSGLNIALTSSTCNQQYWLRLPANQHIAPLKSTSFPAPNRTCWPCSRLLSNVSRLRLLRRAIRGQGVLAWPSSLPFPFLCFLCSQAKILQALSPTGGKGWVLPWPASLFSRLFRAFLFSCNIFCPTHACISSGACTDRRTCVQFAAKISQQNPCQSAAYLAYYNSSSSTSR